MTARRLRCGAPALTAPSTQPQRMTNGWTMTDQQALEHIDQRMTEARDAEVRLSAKQATIDMTRAAFNEAGVLSGPLPDRVRKLADELAAVTADRNNLRAERTQVREMLDGAGIAGDIPAAVQMLLTERAEWRARTPPAPDVAPGGVGWRDNRLYVNGDYCGNVCSWAGGWCATRVGQAGVSGLPGEATARAVLLALAGQECGRVEFGLRESATMADLRKLKGGPLDWVYALLVIDDKPSASAISPASVRAWVEHGQAALTLRAVSGV